MPAGLEAGMDGQSIFVGSARACRGGRSSWRKLPRGCGDVQGLSSVVKWSQRFRSEGSPAARRVGGRRPYALAGERDWLLARLAEQPDVTLRGLLAELATRGIKVSYYAVWHFFEHEGISFKKKPARQRAGSARRGAPAHAVEEVPRPD